MLLQTMYNSVLQVNLNRCARLTFTIHIRTGYNVLPGLGTWILSIRGWHNSLDNNALIYVHPDIKVKIIKNRFFVTAFCIPFDFSISSCYISLNVSISTFLIFLEQLKHLARKINSPLIIGDDFNAHDSFWGSRTIDKRDVLTLDTMAELDLRLMNIGSDPTCIRPQGSSIVDLTWASASIASHITDWRVRQDMESLSDSLSFLYIL